MRDARDASAAFREDWVLPKRLRRPVRFLKRLCSGDVAVPRFAASTMTAAFLALTGLYGAYVGGHMPTYAQAVTARTGFAVDEVKVLGHKQTSEIDILDSLELDGWTSLIGFDAEQARLRVASLPWIEAASVRKVYPDAIEVQVKERQPFALWQHGKDLSVIEKDGRVIAPFTGGSLSHLPQIIGEGASADAADFLERVSAYPALASRVRAYVRVSERRWDLKLNNGVTVQLPENGEDEAMANLLAYDKNGTLMSRDISTIDMRNPDRLVLRLTATGMQQRVAELDAASKARKKASKT